MSDSSLLLQVCFSFAAGIALGIVHFGSLWWNTRMFTRGGSWQAALAVQVARFGVLIAIFVVLARFGALPLLAGALGLLVARQVVMKRLGTA